MGEAVREINQSPITHTLSGVSTFHFQNGILKILILPIWLEKLLPLSSVNVSILFLALDLIDPLTNF